MKLVSLPLDKLLWSIIGDDQYKHIPSEVADILEIVAKGDLCHIQRKDRDGMTFKEPRLWWLTSWRSDTESWRIAKKRDDDARDTRWVFEENVQRVSRAITRETFIEGDAARALAYRKMKQINICRKLITETWGVKLCTNVADIS